MIEGPNRDEARKDLARQMENKTDPNSVISHTSYVAPKRKDTHKFDNRFDESLFLRLCFITLSIHCSYFSI